jgi:hypothetical protein
VFIILVMPSLSPPSPFPPSPPSWINTINGAINDAVVSHMSATANSIANAVEESVSEWTADNWGTLLAAIVLIVALLLCCLYSWISSMCGCLRCASGVVFCNFGFALMCVDSCEGYVAAAFVQAVLIGGWVFGIVWLVARLPFCGLSDLRLDMLMQRVNSTGCEMPPGALPWGRTVGYGLICASVVFGVAFALGLLPLCGFKCCTGFGFIRYYKRAPIAAGSHVKASASPSLRAYGNLDEGEMASDVFRSPGGSRGLRGARGSRHVPIQSAADWNEL